MVTEICRILDIKYPILQGGMAWVADHRLAAAVSEAGGLGIIAAGGGTVDIVRDEIRKAKELTDKPFGVNIMLLNPAAADIAEMVAEEGVRVVTTGAGSPEKYISLWKEAGIKVVPVVASSGHAMRMERSGADAVIAEGCEAGGHIGEITTMALVPQVVDAVNIPVIAAGGIADARGFAAAIMLGARGVQIGTRFLTADETNIHENYKARVINAKDIDSVVTGRSGGHPIRVLRNNMTRRYIAMEKAGAGFEELEALTVGSLRKAAVDGDLTDGSFMAGQIAGLVKERKTCSEIIEEIVSGADELIARYAQ